MYCKKCGNEITKGSKFCNKCGNTLIGGTTSPTGLAKVIAMILGFCCAIVPFLKTLECPDVRLYGINSDGSFSFYSLLKIMYIIDDGNVEEMIRETGGFVTLIFGVLIIIEILIIASYISSVTLLTKNYNNSIQKGWRKMKGTAVGTLGFEILEFIVIYFAMKKDSGDAISNIVSTTGIFYLELIIAIATIIISQCNYDSETLRQYREMKQIHSNKNTWVCPECGKDNPNSSRICKDCGYQK